MVLIGLGLRVQLQILIAYVIFGRKNLRLRIVNMIGQGLELGLYRDGAWVLRYNVLIFIGSSMSLFIRPTAYMKGCDCELCSFTVFSISSCMFYLGVL